MKKGKEKVSGEKKKKKEQYIPKRGILGQGTDYHVYSMDLKEHIIAFLLGFGAAVLVVFLFFRSIWFCVTCGVAAGIFIQGFYGEWLCKKRKKALLFQFRDMLESLTSSYSAGKNTQGAFEDAYSDMVQIYGEEADIARELALILLGIRSNLNIEVLLQDFADRSELVDVQSFADVFEVSVRQGANIQDIIAATRDIINDKIEIEMEIETLLSGNKNELNIMMIMPLIIIVSMEGLGSDMTAVGNSPLNVLIKLASLGIFLGAYLLGRKITDIKI